AITLNAKDNINVEGTVSSKGTTTGGRLILISATSAIEINGNLTNRAGDNSGAHGITLISAGSAFPVFISGSVDSSATAKTGSGGAIGIAANDRLRIGGSVNSTGKVSG